MSILSELEERFRQALSPMVDDPRPLVEMIRRSQDPKFGDYQANFAMPLGKRLGRPPREVAAEVIQGLDVADLCDEPEVAGPGFINLRLRDDRIIERLAQAAQDDRLGVVPIEQPLTYVVDYSAPNVAKPMHVGHIRSTCIGRAIANVLRFRGHNTITDNHIGDWGAQFGMIIYGFRNFLDRAAYEANRVEELARLYRLVRRLVDYHSAQAKLDPATQALAEQEATLAEQRQATGANDGKKLDKKTKKALRRLESGVEKAREELASRQATVASAQDDPAFFKLAGEHPDIGAAVLNETAKLHAGDEDNLRFWSEFLPSCHDEMDRIYNRLGVEFDHTLGESFYHDRLAPVVDELLQRDLARESDGAICVFLEDFDVPMIVRKKDGAFLYATTDLATLGYRTETFQADAILYVVDSRQGDHFKMLFAAWRLMGNEDVELKHVSFGTVLGEDGRPFKTRSGDTVGLESLLDEATRRAAKIVADNDDRKPGGAELSPDERAQVAEVVGTGALVYADLAQNRDSDYVFSYDKMLAMNGNTATYMQYAYARVRSIFRRGGIDPETLRESKPPILLDTPAERALALELLRFGEAIDLVINDCRPNQLTAYLFDLANRYSTFFEQCPVLKAETDELRNSRLMLCDLTARTIAKGLELLGIGHVEKM